MNFRKERLSLLVVVLAAACGSQPDAALATRESAIRKCLPSHPDYPDCGPLPPPIPGDSPECAATDIEGSLWASPAILTPGQKTTLGWSVTTTKNCTLLGQVTLNSQPVSVNGSMQFTPLASVVYRLRLGDLELATTAVTVNLPQTVRITQNTYEQKRMLAQALRTAGSLVLLDDSLDMNLTGFKDISVARGVTMRSEKMIEFQPVNSFAKSAFAVSPVMLPPGPESRGPHRLGPRLYTTETAKPLFVIACSDDDANNLSNGHNVRFSGFRLQGPHYDSMDGDDTLDRGISIDGCRGVTLSNMEISGFTGAGIYISDRPNLLDQNNMVLVQDSYFHHNQHIGGYGYGIDVAPGGYANIQRNVFDFNRHGIDASGQPGTGYRAERNLFLKGGGYHGKWYNEYTHQIDVHGTKACPDIPFYDEDSYNCGDAGERFWISFNAVQYTRDLAVKIRGKPSELAEINNNVFAHGSMGDAVEPLVLGPNVSVGPNRTDIDPFGKYGVCDFDGDGSDDLFLATGVTWWYSSAGRMHWSFLNQASEQLHQLGLGDFDGDGKCDVFTIHNGVGKISSGGRGVWAQIPGTFTMPFDELRFGKFAGDARTDVFWRSPNTEWNVLPAGSSTWSVIQSDPLPLGRLQFGDFDGNGATDVMSSANGLWQISWDARSNWSFLNQNLASDVSTLLVGNADGLPGDDVIRWVVDSPLLGHWELSSGGHGAWENLGSLSWPSNVVNNAIKPAERVKGFVGHFDTWPDADILSLDALTRTTRIWSNDHEQLTSYSLFAQ